MDDEGRERSLLGMAPGILGAGIILYKLLGIKIDPVYILVPLAALSLAFTIRLLNRGLRQKEGKSGWDSRMCKLYHIRSADYRVLDKLVKFMEDRGKRGLARYIASSYYSSSSRSSFILICGVRDLVEREAEVFESFLKVFEGLRVEPSGYISDVFSSTLELRASPHGWAGLVLPPGPGGQVARSRGVLVGDRIDTPVPEPVYLSHSDLEGHVGVFGSTGAGKSTTLRALAERLAASGYRVLVLDWAGEHRIPGFRRINPAAGELPLDPVKVVGDHGLIVDIMTQALGLTDPQAYMLQLVLSSHNPSSIKELVVLLDEMPEEAKWDREVKRALARKLWPLTSGGPAFDSRSGAPRIPGVPAIIDLSGIASPRARRAYALTLLALLYRETRKRGSQPIIVVVDEAHNLLSGDSNLVEEILAEARKYGLYMIYATQSPSTLDTKIINNTNTKIVHRLTSSQDKEYVEKAMTSIPVPLDKLAPGEAVLQSVSYPEPILVKVKPSGYAGNELGYSGVPEPVNPNTNVP